MTCPRHSHSLGAWEQVYSQEPGVNEGAGPETMGARLFRTKQPCSTKEKCLLDNEHACGQQKPSISSKSLYTWTWILVLKITWSWNLCYDAHCASFCTVIHGHPTSSVGFRPGNAMQARLFMQSLVLPLNSSKLISSSIGLDNSVRCMWDNMGSRFDWQHAVAPNLLCLECIQMLVPYCKWATST